MPESKLSPKRSKLRTASDVISRLKWSFDENLEANADNTIMGYECHLNGPMEKFVADYTGINEGGDIPEHRIQYFRLNQEDRKPLHEIILWDRLGRVDRIFGSGEGDQAKINSVTLANARQAIVTMKRLEEEKVIRAQEKANRRARQQAKKALAMKHLDQNHDAAISPSVTLDIGSSSKRHTWVAERCSYYYDTNTQKWTSQDNRLDQLLQSAAKLESAKEEVIKVITWNVLFDLHRNEKNEIVQGDDSLLDVYKDSTRGRWQNLMDTLAEENADIIALQEVTPRFLELLESQTWVQEMYGLSFCSTTEKVQPNLTPYGDMTVWKRSTFSPAGMYRCMDGDRNRGLVASLYNAQTHTMFNVANVHLPADQWDTEKQETRDRTIARQRELSAVVGKLQLLEQEASNAKVMATVPIILGDFNTGDEDKGLVVSSVFEDAWTRLENYTNNENLGLTFDWKRNARARVTMKHGHSHREPRRIDRVFVGACDNIMNPVEGKLLGDTGRSNYPPSDHFGVQIMFAVKPSRSNKGCFLNTSSQNAWASMAVPTKESLLALVIDNESSSSNGPCQLFDPKSTLPMAHVTLLNGFVDLSSTESQILATQVVEKAVREALYSDGDDEDDQTSMTTWDLPMDQTSMSVFEHSTSATLVCVPDTQCPQGAWLPRLYQTLRAQFALCNGNERRFSNSSWKPHVSLGKFPTASEARKELESRLTASEESNDTNYGQNAIRAYGIGLFRRDASDGKLYHLVTVPLAKAASLTDTRSFVADAGAAWSSSMKGASNMTIQEVQRASQTVADMLSSTNGGPGLWTANVVAYGSHSLGTALPGISDLDIVIKLQPVASQSSGNGNTVSPLSGSQFFQALQTRLEYLHPEAKIRRRISNSNGTALYVMTAKLFPNAPFFVDILFCGCNDQGQPLDEAGQAALDSISDSQQILSSMKQSLKLKDSTTSNFGLEACRGALRIIKLWAHRRQIYGSILGYLGGGGWAVLFAWVLEQRQDDAIKAVLGASSNKKSSTSIAAQNLAKMFFDNVCRCWRNARVVELLSSSSDENHAAGTHGNDNVVVNTRLQCDLMAVLAPISGGNLGRSSTPSTTRTTWTELLNARQRLAKKLSSLEDILKDAFRLEQVPEVLVIHARIPPGTKPAETKAKASTLVLHLAVAMERKNIATDIRICTQVVKKKNGSFLFRIGMGHCHQLSQVRDFVAVHNEILKPEHVTIEYWDSSNSNGDHDE